MADTYPYCMYCRFEGFPARTRYVCGQAFDRLPLCPYSYGSRVDCRQTPLSGRIQGELAQDQRLPLFEMISSDTGEDEEFGLKVSSYGYGTFFLADEDAQFQSLAVVKGIRVEAAGLRKAFETLDLWETRIPASTFMWEVPETPETLWRDAKASGRFAALWYAGQAPQGSVSVQGVLQLTGQAFVQVLGDAP